MVGDVGEGPEVDAASDDEKNSVNGSEEVGVKPGSESMGPKD